MSPTLILHSIQYNEHFHVLKQTFKLIVLQLWNSSSSSYILQNDLSNVSLTTSNVTIFQLNFKEKTATGGETQIRSFPFLSDCPRKPRQVGW
jgi:hypothetical protein